jgi:ElaB/YqjD/DUF883 family membrane-anchored ribosome-binding protein
VAVSVFFKALGVCPIAKSECSPIAGGFSCIYGKRFLRGFVLRKRISANQKGETKMANENFGSTGGESSPQNKRAQSESEWRSTSEDMKSTVTALPQDYTDQASKELNETKQRLRTLREDGEDYVRENPMKAVMTALGIGFVLGLIFRH